MPSPSAHLMLLAHRAASRMQGGWISYEQDGSCWRFRATYGRAPNLADDPARDGAMRIEYGVRDFIFPAHELKTNDALIEPKDGAKITILDEHEPDAGQVYEVMPLPGEKAWHSCDPQGVLLRVHTKLWSRTGS